MSPHPGSSEAYTAYGSIVNVTGSILVRYTLCLYRTANVETINAMMAQLSLRQ